MLLPVSILDNTWNWSIPIISRDEVVQSEDKKSFTYLSCIRKMGKPAHGFAASVRPERHNKKSPERGT